VCTLFSEKEEMTFHYTRTIFIIFIKQKKMTKILNYSGRLHEKK